MDIAKPTLDKDFIIKQQADALARLEERVDELVNQLVDYKRDNFDLQADIDRLRHQLEAIKNIIAL